MARHAVSRSASVRRVKTSVSSGETSTGHNAIEPAARSRHHATTDTVAPNPPDRSTLGPLRVAMAGARPVAQCHAARGARLQHGHRLAVVLADRRTTGCTVRGVPPAPLAGAAAGMASSCDGTRLSAQASTAAGAAHRSRYPQAVVVAGGVSSEPDNFSVPD